MESRDTVVRIPRFTRDALLIYAMDGYSLDTTNIASTEDLTAFNRRERGSFLHQLMNHSYGRGLMHVRCACN